MEKIRQTISDVRSGRFLSSSHDAVLVDFLVHRGELDYDPMEGWESFS